MTISLTITITIEATVTGMVYHIPYLSLSYLPLPLPYDGAML
jgi:hypothetical protein